MYNVHYTAQWYCWWVNFILLTSSIFPPYSRPLLMPLMDYQSFKLRKKNLLFGIHLPWHWFIWQKTTCFVCSKAITSKKPVRILLCFSLSSIATLFSIYFGIRYEPIQNNLLMKICQQPKSSRGSEREIDDSR